VPDVTPVTPATPATPAAAGFAMPPEWAPHAACLMAWPSRLALWGGRFAEARRDYATVARAIADFEPVLMVCNPGVASEVGMYSRLLTPERSRVESVSSSGWRSRGCCDSDAVLIA